MSKKNKQHSHIPTLLVAFSCLIVLTIVTVTVSNINFGYHWLNVTVAMSIASIKGWLILYYFMHLKWEDKLVKYYAALSFPFIILFIGVDVMDIIFRIYEKQF